MSRKREPMRKIKEVLRLSAMEGMSERLIARAANMKKSTVRDYLFRVARARLTWSIASSMSDEQVECLLFPPGPPVPSEKGCPDWLAVRQDLQRKHVTLQLLWEEYRETHLNGYSYSHFCDLYQRFSRTLDLSMRQTHKPGEKLFVDYAGGTIPVVDAKTGEVKDVQIFVAVMGASNFTYSEATWSQGLRDWIESHVRAFTYLGGVPTLIVPDNLKAGVKKPCLYDPEINPTYQRLAEHYQVAVMPARVAHPKDKAKVENGVLLVERWILARLRNRTFFSLAEVNEAIEELLERLNHRPFRKLSGTRRTLFDEVDKPVLKPLPATPFEFEEWKKARVNIDYHVEFAGHYYSVPCQLVKDVVEIRATSTVIEVYMRSRRVAVHARSYHKNTHTTVTEHMPKAHQAHAEWSPSRLIAWGAQSGAHIAALFEAIMRTRDHPEQGFRSCLGIMRLASKVGKERLNAACERALRLNGLFYSFVRNILEKGLDRKPLPPALPETRIQHENLRGASYFSPESEEHHVDESNY